MALHNINPTETKAWQDLSNHFEQVKDLHMRELFADDFNRKEQFSITLNDELRLDYSKNRITSQTMHKLFDFANEVQLKDAIHKYFTGDVINTNQCQSVLHTALRSSSETPIFVNNKDIKPKIKTTLRKIRVFSNKVISGKWKGYSGKLITDVVNVGIGGSDLGPDMIVKGLNFYKNRLNTHFVSNVDGDYIKEVLEKLNPETTLFVIVSKSFSTQETITNANTIRDWFLKSGSLFDIAKHFVAVSTNIKEVENFGISKENIFPIWNWVGGRFSLWSAVGLSISLAIGFDNFKQLLEGAEKIDNHFRDTEFENNIPVVLALLSVWYNNFFNCETELVLPYTQYLSKLPMYLQQAVMESNGKSVDRNGKKVTYQTGNIIWGTTGTNAQHAFMQLVHQGTKLIPCDFIGFKNSLHGLKDHHIKLMTNFYAQIDALAFGKTEEEVYSDLKTQKKYDEFKHLIAHKVFEGNKPSNVMLFDKLTPHTLGMLISIYEHKIFVQGILWNIYSFDQYGVELGKEIYKNKINFS